MGKQYELVPDRRPRLFVISAPSVLSFRAKREILVFSFRAGSGRNLEAQSFQQYKISGGAYPESFEGLEMTSLSDFR